MSCITSRDRASARAAALSLTHRIRARRAQNDQQHYQNHQQIQGAKINYPNSHNYSRSHSQQLENDTEYTGTHIPSNIHPNLQFSRQNEDFSPPYSSSQNPKQRHRDSSFRIIYENENPPKSAESNANIHVTVSKNQSQSRKHFDAQRTQRSEDSYLSEIEELKQTVEKQNNRIHRDEYKHHVKDQKIAELNADLIFAQTALNQAEENVNNADESLTNELTNVRMEKENAEKDAASWKHKFEALKEEFQSAQRRTQAIEHSDDTAQLCKKLEERQNEVEHLEKVISDRTAEQYELYSTQKKLKADLAFQVTDIAALKRKMDSQANYIKNLNLKITALVTETKSKSRKIARQTTRLQRYSLEVNSLSNALSDSRKKEEEKSTLLANIQSQNLKNLSKHQEILEKEAAQNEYQSYLESEIKLKDTRIIELEAELQAISHDLSIRPDIEQEYALKLVAFSAEKVDMEQDLFKTKAILQDKTVRVGELENKIKEIETEKLNAENLQQQNESIIIEQENNLSQLRSKLSQTEEENRRHLKQKTHEFESAKKEFNDELFEKSFLASSRKTELLQKEYEIDNLNKKLQEKSELTQTNKSLNEENKTLQKKFQDSDSQVSKLKTKASKYKEYGQQLEKENEKLSKINLSLNKQSTKIVDLETQVKYYKQILDKSAIEKEFNTLRQTMENGLSSLQTKLLQDRVVDVE